VSQARVIYFGLVGLYLAAALVQFFLAGLAVFGDTSFDPHTVLGFILGITSLVLLIVALVARLPRTLLLLTVLLVGLNVLQMVLANIDVSEIAALHPVNGVAIVFLAYELTQRSRRYVASKMAA
jgi:multisubunit Na+/H+ antiporter MnhE subunit